VGLGLVVGWHVGLLRLLESLALAFICFEKDAFLLLDDVYLRFV